MRHKNMDITELLAERKAREPKKTVYAHHYSKSQNARVLMTLKSSP